MGKITKKMIDEFNKYYLIETPLKIEKTEIGDNCWEIKLTHGYIKHAIITPSDSFYNILESYFIEKEIKLGYNNIGTIFWAIDTIRRK